MRRVYICLFIVLYSKALLAVPNNLQIWFLKEPTFKKTSSYINQLYPDFLFLGKIASNQFNCTLMGNGCFHPQLGFIEDDKKVKKGAIKKDVKLKTFNSLENQLVTCDKDYHFDLYCGKERKGTKKGWDAKTEIWVDISSSLFRIDPTDKSGNCYRKQFVESIVDKCGGRDKVNVKIYNTVKKELGSYDSLCMNYGTNNTDRLIDWIEEANVKNLVIITDVSELSLKFGEYLEKVRATTRGADATDYYAKDLLLNKKEILKFCKN